MDSVGTYSYCSSCTNASDNCCSNFDKIDNPLITDNEYVTIKNSYNKKFCSKTSKKLYKLNVLDNKCVFFQDSRCVIYSMRPIDCRLFPFDIIKKQDNYYLILYKEPCKNFEYGDKFINENINDIDKLICEIKPYLEEYTAYDVNKKLANKEYEIIKEI